MHMGEGPGPGPGPLQSTFDRRSDKPRGRPEDFTRWTKGGCRLNIWGDIWGLGNGKSHNIAGKGKGSAIVAKVQGGNPNNGRSPKKEGGRGLSVIREWI